MKSLMLTGAVSLAFTCAFQADKSDFEIQEYEKNTSLKLTTASKAAHESWKDQRFGMFIHWGPISQLGQQLGHSRNSPSHRTGGKHTAPARRRPSGSPLARLCPPGPCARQQRPGSPDRRY